MMEENLEDIQQELNQLRAELEASRRAQSMLEKTVQNLEVGVCTTDEDLRIVSMSGVFLSLVGHTQEELFEQPFSTLLLEEDWIHFAETQNQALHKKDPIRSEWRLINANGKILTVRITAQKHLDANNQAQLLFSVEDITESSQYRGLLETTQEMTRVGGWELDLATRQMRWTEEIYRIYDLPKNTEVSLGLSLRYFFKESAKRARKILQLTESQGLPLSDEFEMINEQGKFFHVRMTARPGYLNGKIVKIYGAFQDITARKRQHEELARSEQLYRNLAVNFPRGLILVINRGFGIEFAEGKGLEELGHTKASLENNTLPNFLGKAFDRSVESTIWETFDGHPGHVDMVINGLDFSVETRPLKNSQGYIDRLLWVAINITDRKEWERRLMASEVRYRELFKSNPSPIVVVDENTGDILTANTSAMSHYGYTLTELRRLKWHELRREEPHDIDPVSLTGQEYQKHITKSGALIYVEIKSKAIQFSDNTATLMIINDVTDRLIATQKLQTSHQALEQFHNALDAASLVARLDPKGVITTANINFCQSCGIPQNNLVGKSIQELPNLTPNEEQFSEIKDFIRAKKYWKGEVQLHRPDGSVFWLDCTVIPQTTESGQAGEILVISQDISEKKAAEEQIDRYAKRSIAILESITDAMFLINEDWQVLYINNLGENLLRVSRDEIINNNLHQIFPPEEAEGFYAQYSKAFTENRVVHFEEYYAPLSTWFEVHAYPSAEGLSVYFRSINERKEAEVRIKESENSLKEAQRIARMGNWEYRVGSQEVVWSDELFRLFNLNPRTDTPSLDLILRQIHREDKPKVFRALRYAWNDASGFDLDMRVIREDETRHLNFICRPETNENGEFVKLYGILTDITERKEAEENLIRSENMLREAQQLGKMGSWEFFPSNGKLQFSDEVYRLLALDHGSEVPTLQSQVDKVYQEDRNEVIAAFTNAAAKGKPFDLDFRIHLPDGTLRYFNTVGEPELDSSGRLKKMHGTLMDITDRKDAEAQIRASEAWFKGIFNSTQDGIVVQREEQIVFANEALAQQFGYSAPEELIGKKVGMLHTKENYPKMKELAKHRLDGKPDVSSIQEILCIKNDGSLFDVEIRSSVLEIQGEKFLISTANDITERKQAEKELKESNEQLKKTNAELDRFVYSASHDLRAPMVSVLGLINLAKKETEMYRLQEYMDLMEKSVRKLDSFVQEIIHYSRNSRLEVRHEPIDFKDLIEGVIEDLQFMDEAKLVERQLFYDIEEDFFTDKNRLSVVINNMISNAFRYSSSHRRKSFLHVYVEVKGGKAVLRFKDNGQGIAPEHQKDIFKMFYRASESSKGSGLGLYIVRETIEKLGGEISVSSVLGKGTEFTIELPSLEPTEDELSATEVDS